jgi:hypothetical protein
MLFVSSGNMFQMCKKETGGMDFYGRLTMSGERNHPHFAPNAEVGIIEFLGD